MSLPEPAAPSTERRTSMQRNALPIIIVLLLFCTITILRNDSSGSDLAPSYIAARLIAQGQQSHIYAHDPILFNRVSDGAWANAAIGGGIRANYGFPPYVQTPLWAYTLAPLCNHISFKAFVYLFLILTTLCFAALLWIVATHWTPHLFHTYWIALICTGLYLTEPFQYSIALVQTHIIFVLLSIAALILARHHPIKAGTLLALAAAVKITPGLLLIYWLTTRQFKAAFSFIASSIALAVITFFAVGADVSFASVHEYARLSDVLLVAFNNQSLAATWMGHLYPASELFVWHIFQTPTTLKIASLVLSIASNIAGGCIDSKSGADRGAVPLYGAVFAMVGTTIFATIAWSHYFVLLVVPVMMMLNAIHRDSLGQLRYRFLLAFTIAIVLLNVYPFSYREVLMHPYIFHHVTISMVRSEFYAGLIALMGLAMLALNPHHAQA